MILAYTNNLTHHGYSGNMYNMYNNTNCQYLSIKQSISKKVYSPVTLSEAF